MALHFDLKVNGSTIGTFAAQRVWPAYGKPDGVYEYSVSIEEILPGEIVTWHGVVEHRYDDGAWALVMKALEQRRGVTRD